MYGNNPRSTAQIAGHPLHPLMIPFPMVGFISAFATDVAFKVTGNPKWANASKWLLGLGLVGSVGAAATGFTDYLGDDRVPQISEANQHMIANVSLVAIQAVNLGLRVVSDKEEVSTANMALSSVAFAILGYSGWLGGELVYRHRVGVQETVDQFSGYDDGHAEGGLGIPRGPALDENIKELTS